MKNNNNKQDWQIIKNNKDTETDKNKTETQNVTILHFTSATRTLNFIGCKRWHSKTINPMEKHHFQLHPKPAHWHGVKSAKKISLQSKKITSTKKFKFNQNILF